MHIRMRYALPIELLNSVREGLSELYGVSSELNATLHQLSTTVGRIQQVDDIIQNGNNMVEIHSSMADNVLAKAMEQFELEYNTHKHTEDVSSEISLIFDEVRELEHVMEELHRTKEEGRLVLATATEAVKVSVNRYYSA